MQHLLDILRNLQIRIELTDGKLFINAPPGVVTNEIRASIRSHKEALIDYLRATRSSGEKISQYPRAMGAPALSFAQQRLWFLDQFDPGSTRYNMPAAIRFSGQLNVTALRRTISEIVRRHEALRTTFAKSGGEPVQVIAPFLDLALPLTDLRDVATEDRDAQALALVQAEAQKPFDLSKGPLVRAVLLCLSDSEHILALTVHHIVSDGWSMNVLVREIGALYGAYVQGQASPLPELEVQYADFSQWQRAWLSGDLLESQLTYWRKQLAGAPTLLSLPTDRPRPATQRHRGARFAFAISSGTTTGLHALGKETQTTLFMTLSAVFTVLLSRHAGQTDICIGTPIANRGRSELESLIGFFVNTLVLRTRVDAALPFRALLQQMRTTTLGAYAHQDVPFEQLVEVLRPERHTSHTPLFQAVLALQNTPREALELPDLDLRPVMIESVTSAFDLSLNVTEGSERLMCAFEYNTDLFDATTIERMAGHLVMLLGAVAADPDCAIRDLPMLQDAERQLLLRAWNQTQQDYPEQQTVNRLFEELAAKTPQAVALVFQDTQLSYAELNAKANHLAHYLQGRGVGPDVLVGLCIERSLEMIVGLLGILKAGGAYVPLDPAYPAERLAYMLDDARPALLLTQERLLGSLPENACARFCLDSQWGELAEDETNPVSAVQAANLAYVIYTSGSTGKPKGTLLSHRGLRSLAHAQAATFDIQPGQRILQFSSFGFDASTWEIFMALLSNATLCLATRDQLMPGESLEGTLERLAISAVTLPPVALNTLSPAAASGLQTIVVAGEACPRTLAEQWAGGRHFFNAYGPTESTVCASVYRCHADEPFNPPIGRPIPNSQIYLLDSALNPVPVGVAGELHIAGEGLARGYLNRPDMTAEKFIANPFGAAGSRMYKSGDLARYLADGNIEYLGRIDNQVKLRGFRIELGEIEAALTALEQVREALVLTREDEPGDKRLVAYVVAAGQGSLDAAQLRLALQRVLPEYMVPAHFIALEEFPLTPSGKVDRQALPLRELAHSAKDYVAPRTPTEEVLAVIWAGILKLERVSIYDNFFALGGHSLIAAQLVARIRDAFDVQLVLRDVFEQQGLQEQASLVDEKRAGDHARPSRIEPVSRDSLQPLPLSFAQQRLWFLSRMMAPNAVYNIPFALRLRGELDEHALVWALNGVVQRHEALRTRFVEIDGQAAQIIDAPAEQCVVVEEIDSEAALVAHYLAERSHHFDLSREPLYRLRSLRTRYDGHYVLLATFHHIVFDGWSMGVFLKELVQLYRAAHGRAAQGRAAQGRQAAPLPPLAIQYADYAAWQRQQLTDEVSENQFKYWERQLAGLPPLLELPTDWPRPAEQRYRGATAFMQLDAPLVDTLQALNRACGSTLFMSLISAFAVLLGRHARQDDVAIGTPIANRRQSETEALIGFFLNSLVMRFDLGGKRSFKDVLRATREMALQAYAHQDIPFEHLVERLNPARSLSHSPLFQVSCSLVNTPVDGRILSGIDVEAVHFQEAEGEGVARYDLTFNFSIMADGSVRGSMEYNIDLFAAQTIERMLVHYQRLIEAIVVAPDTALQDIDFLSEAERQQQVLDWNRTTSSYPQASVHALFEQQAASRPDAIAVVDGVSHLSYGELDRRANRLAHYLIAHGVNADSCVGLCVERSADMLVGMLGILKAGGAYVPLDPGYPEMRLKHMIETSASRLILCEQHLLEELSLLSDYPTLPLDGRWHAALLGSYPDTAPKVEVAPDNLAYVIFTSGSTGMPKGVLISHASVVSLVCSGDDISVGADVIVGQAASHAFDAITYELWAPLLGGGRVVLIDKATLLSPPALAACLTQQQVGSLFITTALFNRISEEMPQAFSGLGQVLFGGEAYSAPAIARVLQEGGPRQLLHVYGPTESTTFATGFSIEKERFLQDRQAPIGMPLANTTAYVMHWENLAPLGAIGELCLGGDGLARGYMADAGLTASKFVPHPFATTPGQRLYRTGDLVLLRDDGAIEFKGRVDDQVKVRGFRIELGEIEQALREHPEVDHGMVLAREDQPGERHLVAYIVPKETAGGELAANLVQYLKGRIPDYALPGAFVMLVSLPLNANGKVDRHRLPVPDESAYAHAQYVAPSNALEERLAALWRANLGREGVTSIGTHDNYFAIGGDSIRSISLVSSAKAEGLQFAIKDLFAHPTIAELATVVAEVDAHLSLPDTVAPFALLTAAEKAQLPSHYKGQEVIDAYPLSALQQGMWFHTMLNPESSVYHCVITFTVKSEWQPDVFREALGRAIERHPILRTEFHLTADRPLQCVTAFRTPVMEVLDLRERAAGEREASIRAWGLEEKKKGLRIDELWRVGVLLFRDQHIQFGLSFHHALWDGWSDATLVAELFSCYKSLLQREVPALQTLPPSYNRYIALEQRALAAPEHRDYWAQCLADARQPWWSATPCQAYAQLYCDISETMSANALALADVLRVQEKSVWCAVYLVLTSMIEGDDRILGSVVTHGRPEIADAEKMVGLFLNSLPIQVDMRGATWAELVTGVNAQLNQHQAHRHYPLAQIQADLRLDFSASLFNFTNFHVLSSSMAGSNVIGSSSFALDDTNYLFSVDVQKSDISGRHLFRIKLDPKVFDAAFQQRIKHYVANIIEQMGADRNAPIDKLGLLGDEQEKIRQFRCGDVSAQQPVAASGLLHVLFEEQVRKSPDSLAAEYDGQTLTYAELNSRANQLAHYLRAQGVGPDQLVAICLERGLGTMVGLMGILKAGGAYVPLEASYPAERLAYMLNDAAPKVLITQQSLKALLSPTTATLVVLDALDGAFVGQDCENPDALAMGMSPSNLAYMIYTSGSTGQPKGAMNQHGAVVNRLRWMQDQYRLGQDDRILQKTPFGFDVSVWEFFWPLLHGASLVFARPQGHQDPRYLAQLIRSAGITTLHFVPAMLQAFLEQNPEHNAAGELASACASLRTIVCSGEELSVDLQTRCLARLPHARLHNLYGPTEAAIDVTYWECRVESGAIRVPIGRPIWNTQIHILDAVQRPVPLGVAGEIYIGGIGVARGYHNRPQLTAERFIADPFSQTPGGRMYRTGDLGRFRTDGSVEYLGRNDHQIKIRGFRIELGEIESQLNRHPSVNEVVVLAREDVPGDKRLVAYLVPAGQEVLDVAQLRQALQQHLPDYMVPSYFVVLEALPLTPNGKVDRKALPAPEATRSENGYVAPRTPVEDILAGIWAEILKLDRVGVEDDFFELGGHSLLAARLISRVRSTFDTEVPLRTLFEAPTVAAFAARLVSLRQEQAARSAPAIVPIVRHGALPLSYAQQRLWFLDQFAPGQAFYNMPSAFRLKGVLNVTALADAFNEVMRRHEALRTTFVMIDETPVQVIAPASKAALPWTDLSDLLPAEREAKAQWLMQDEAQTAFDLSNGPLIRSRLIKLAEDDHLFLFTVHHIVSDGWSMNVLVNELASLYSAYVNGKASPLAELPVQYADYASWQRQWLSGDVLEQQLRYWQGQLAGAPTLLSLPTDRPRPALQSHRGATKGFRIDAQSTAGLHGLCKQTQSTLFMSLAAVFNVMLCRYAQQSDICLGTVIANRNRAEVEGLIGFFVNTLVLRTQVNGGERFSDLLKRVRSTALEAYAHQDVPFEQLVEAVKPERHTSHSPLFQVMLVLQNTPRGALSLPDVSLQPLMAGGTTSRYDLTLNVMEGGAELLCGLEYNTDLFDGSTIERMAGHFTALLQAAVADPEMAVRDLTMLQQAEREELLVGWNRTAQAWPRGESAQQLFEAQAARTPGSVALVFEEQALTYAELNARANRLAHHLRGQGVGPDVLVGLCVERSLDMVVGLLGVMKAGGAYIPLDPAYPQDRLAYMLEDARPAVLLTQEKLAATFGGSFSTFRLDSQWQELAVHDANPEHVTQPDNLTYVIYTSGSTGKPKGVGVYQRGLVNFLHSMAQQPGIEAEDRLLCVTSLSFDIAGLEIFLPLISGARTVIVSRETALDPQRLAETIEAQQITLMQATPSTWRLLLNHGWPSLPHKLKVLCGGEALPLELMQQLLEHVPAIWNLYGPTESTIWSSAHCIDNGERNPVIGRPIANTSIYLLDEALNPVPVGVAGELYIAGAGLARGYLNRAGLTAEKFLPDPYSREPGARMYRAGDLARYLPNGEIDYLGRVDNQVKIRGFRIEPGEIEAALTGIAEVGQALVVAREDEPGDKRLVAYVVAAGAAGELDAASLRQALQQSLPEYMVPSHIMILEQMPLTPNGKLDRKALPAPEATRSEMGYVAPRTATEEMLADIWAEVLKLDRVGIHDNFFELGGHSLLAVQVLNKITQKTSQKIPLEKQFAYQTVSLMSAHIDEVAAQSAPRTSVDEAIFSEIANLIDGSASEK